MPHALAILLQSLYPHKGKLTRKEYGLIMLTMVIPITVWIVIMLKPMVDTLSGFQPGAPIDLDTLPDVNSILLAAIPLTYISLTTTAQRFRDAGKTPLLTFLLLIPYIGLGAQVYAFSLASSPKQ